MKVEYQEPEKSWQKFSDIPDKACFIAERRDGLRMKLSKDSYFHFDQGAVYFLCSCSTITYSTNVEVVDAKLVWSKR
jgi:hypothetical protein